MPVTWLPEQLTFARWYAAHGDSLLVPAVRAVTDTEGTEGGTVVRAVRRVDS
ncbi:hypothetical protein [Streptomyces sp. NPDC127114]|uniref:hypothetical protein n=1 Tax=Streptomyces sp. NPDC127114 TaxID=3345366 RepID=UPI003628423D